MNQLFGNCGVQLHLTGYWGHPTDRHVFRREIEVHHDRFIGQHRGRGIPCISDIVSASIVIKALTRPYSSLSTFNRNHPIVALAIDLGSIESTTSPVVWAIGHVRENLLTAFGGSAGLERRSSYFWSQYTTIADGVSSPPSPGCELIGSYHKLD
jgi:hypothetical protein